MTICHNLLQYTTYMLSYQSKSNELREARDVFFQWLSGRSQTGKCLVDLYENSIARDLLSREDPYGSSIRIYYGNSIALANHSLDLFAQLRDLLWEFYRVRYSLT